MSRTGDWIIELMEKGEWEEEPNGYDYSPHDYATSQPEWHETLGKGLELVYQALKDNDRTQNPAFDLYHQAEYFAVQVISHKAPCTLETAYQLLGLKTDITEKDLDELPF